ncbi:glycosyltransferase family A protein [Pedococcus sp. KACC 23699]|uniref:Glycosyltransferase family A protein n=1 Tax=Pedococcus sp. KACC 23699 TaxID=3149228 RepID=A0AAU7JX81_9MICO
MPIPPPPAGEQRGPDVDVVIAVHSALRPLDRAISSCHTGSGRVRVTVVCHNIASDEIQAGVQPRKDLPVRYVELHDGLNSPAGPKNAGLQLADAPYVLVLDSDDFLEPGAIQHWLELATARNADGVIVPLRHQSGAVIRTPRARASRIHDLDPVQDRLAYATAPRGLWRTGLLRSIGFKYTEGLQSGEDLAPGLHLWFSGATFEFPARGPRYVQGNDAVDRVTDTFLPLSREFDAIYRLDPRWLDSLTAAARRAVAVKLARTNLIGAMARRSASWDWSAEDLSAVEDLIRRLDEIHPGFRRPFARADRRLLNAAARAQTAPEAFLDALRQQRGANLLDRLLTPGLTANLDSESTLRQALRMAADWRRIFPV